MSNLRNLTTNRNLSDLRAKQVALALLDTKLTIEEATLELFPSILELTDDDVAEVERLVFICQSCQVWYLTKERAQSITHYCKDCGDIPEEYND